MYLKHKINDIIHKNIKLLVVIIKSMLENNSILILHLLVIKLINLMHQIIQVSIIVYNIK